MRAGQLICFVTCFMVVIAAAGGCAYTKKEVVQAPCVIADSVFYAKDIAPIISSNCSNCHTGIVSSGIPLDNYNAVKFYAGNGYLYGTISHAAGYKQMPEGRSRLNDCTIATVKKWIDKGTPQ